MFLVHFVVVAGKRFRNIFIARKKKLYEQIEAEMASSADWPPTPSADLSLAAVLKLETQASEMNAHTNEGIDDVDGDSASESEAGDLGSSISRHRLNFSRSNSNHATDSMALLSDV